MYTQASQSSTSQWGSQQDLPCPVTVHRQRPSSYTAHTMLPAQEPIDIYCDQCGITWWRAIPGNEYSVLPPTEPTIMFQVHTNAPAATPMAAFQGDGNRVICPSQCQAPLNVWVADSGSGLVNLHGCKVAISCGSRLGRITKAAASPPAAIGLPATSAPACLTGELALVHRPSKWRAVTCMS